MRFPVLHILSSQAALKPPAGRIQDRGQWLIAGNLLHWLELSQCCAQVETAPECAIDTLCTEKVSHWLIPLYFPVCHQNGRLDRCTSGLKVRLKCGMVYVEGKVSEFREDESIYSQEAATMRGNFSSFIANWFFLNPAWWSKYHGRDDSHTGVIRTLSIYLGEEKKHLTLGLYFMQFLVCFFLM